MNLLLDGIDSFSEYSSSTVRITHYLSSDDIFSIYWGMTRAATPCETRFREAAPISLYESLSRHLQLLYPAEYKKVMDAYSGEAALTLLPHQRRARLESDLPLLMHSLGIKTTVEQFPNTTDTFVLIHLSDDVKLIVCYVKNETQALRYAKARADLTADSNQPYLIPPTEGRLILGRETLFAILAHSPLGHDIGQFGNAYFHFPSPDQITSLGQLNLREEMERVQREAAKVASVAERKVEINIKKGG